MKEYLPEQIDSIPHGITFYRGLKAVGAKSTKAAEEAGYLLIQPRRGSREGLYIRQEDLPRWKALTDTLDFEESVQTGAYHEDERLHESPPIGSTLEASEPTTPAKAEGATTFEPTTPAKAEGATTFEPTTPAKAAPATTFEPTTPAKAEGAALSEEDEILPKYKSEEERQYAEDLLKKRRDKEMWLRGKLQEELQTEEEKEAIGQWSRRWPLGDLTVSKIRGALRNLRAANEAAAREAAKQAKKDSPKNQAKKQQTSPKMALSPAFSPSPDEAPQDKVTPRDKATPPDKTALKDEKPVPPPAKIEREAAKSTKPPESRKEMRARLREEILNEMGFLEQAEEILGEEIQGKLGRDTIEGLARISAEEVASMLMDQNFKSDRVARARWHFERKIERYHQEYKEKSVYDKRLHEARTFVEGAFREEWETWATQIRAYCHEHKMEAEGPLKKAWSRIEDLLHDYNGEESIQAFKRLLTKRQEEIEATLKEHFRQHYQREAFHKLYHWRSDFAQYFPTARSLRRKIFFFCGPTNSGKTFSAMNDLAASENGVYLAPLRLMALEGQQELYTRGKPSSFLTGEERDLIEGAKFVASTIEMLDYETIVESVVIDEIQMISDPYRGWAWTNALVGAPAERVILTGSADAIPIVEKIAAYLQEPLEIRHFKRFNQLEPLTEPSELDEKSLQPGTAIICFSRKDVLSLKQHVEFEIKQPVSVIYGSLSPEVRREEARRFRQKETQILIATDAISMGLNLPIRTVLFWQTAKRVRFQTQDISDSEIKQIAGRAGRYGHEPKGYVGAFTPEDLQRIREALDIPLEPIEGPCAIMPLLFHLEMIAHVLRTTDMEEILHYFQTEIWFSFDLFRPMVTDEMLLLAKTLREPLKDATLRLKYTFVCAPVDANISHILDAHVSFARQYVKGEEVQLPEIPYQEYRRGFAKTPEDLRVVEDYVKIVTLYRWLSFRFPEQFSQVEHADYCRRILNDYISRSLSQGKLLRRCASCGRILSFDVKFKICERCYRRR